jgi:endonuclease/exonuclease/phosphatase family metal-dependent hydrolase
MMQTGARYGMQLLNDALEKHVAAGLVEPLEAYDRCIDKEDFAKRMKARGVDIDALQEAAATAHQAARPQVTMQGSVPAPAAGADKPAPASPAAQQPPPGQAGPTWRRPGT